MKQKENEEGLENVANGYYMPSVPSGPDDDRTPYSW